MRKQNEKLKLLVTLIKGVNIDIISYNPYRSGKFIKIINHK